MMPVTATRVVLFLNGQADLYLTSVKDNGNRLVGWVENGCWDFWFERGKRKMYHAKKSIELNSDNLTRELRDTDVVKFFPVPKEVKGHYNDVMSWAQTEWDTKNGVQLTATQEK